MAQPPSNTPTIFDIKSVSFVLVKLCLFVCLDILKLIESSFSAVDVNQQRRTVQHRNSSLSSNSDRHRSSDFRSIYRNGQCGRTDADNTAGTGSIESARSCVRILGRWNSRIVARFAAVLISSCFYVDLCIASTPSTTEHHSNDGTTNVAQQTEHDATTDK